MFQKITWVLGTIFMAGSLFLVIIGSSNTQLSTSRRAPMPMKNMPVQEESAPSQTPVEPAA